MDTSTIIEAIGYVGSTLVLVSFLMTSVVKLRIVNSVGSIIFTVYAFIIHSYPTAIMNLCLVAINIYYLVKLNRTSVEYDIVKINKEDSIVKYVFEVFGEDMKKCFPGITLDFSGSNVGYAVCHKGAPIGLLIGKKNDGELDIDLDYCVPEYRDFSMGRYLQKKLPEEGIKKLIYRGSDANHKAYLTKTGFVEMGGYYEKNL